MGIYVIAPPFFFGSFKSGLFLSGSPRTALTADAVGCASGTSDAAKEVACGKGASACGKGASACGKGASACGKGGTACSKADVPSFLLFNRAGLREGATA